MLFQVKREIFSDSDGTYLEIRTWGPGIVTWLFFGAPASIKAFIFFMFSNPIGKHMFFRIQLQNPIEFFQLPFGLYIRQVSRMFLAYPLRLGTHNSLMYSKVFAENRYAMLPYFYAQIANFSMSKNKTCL